jgi:integrase
MVREANKLSPLAVKRLKEPGRYCDGLGLWLQVTESTSGNGVTKAWLFRYQRHGRPRQMGLGALHTVSLAEARERARQARQILLDGDDPIEIKRKKRDEARSETAERISFRDAAERFLDLHKAEWRNKKHRQQWENTLKTYAYPSLGSRPISAIDGALITEALSPIWTKKRETARRVKQRIERVVQWIKDGQPMPAGISKHVTHHPAMMYEAVPEFMVELRKRESISARALEFTCLTVARTGDTIGARWSEIDLDRNIWAITVTDERTHKKATDVFEIPLSKRAVEILKELPREKGSHYVFLGAKAKEPLSNAAMAELLKGMHKARARSGLPPWSDRVSGRLAVPHGFRSSFRDWAGDRTNFARELIETAMSHKIKDRAEAAYRRTAALEKRRQLMEAWAKYCSLPAQASGQVVALHG